ncbi:unnamed protein product [Pseudo-nitzschia multistriata]|uniref:Tyrosinase copper-binding domain-containing protein n=1 Tax=Pseudo-nitzschia multistriata TaxID=183589 RepID=A0A448YWC2_9STRA|nr:unnamed protein product [Pseudo-nitzschia multistriata]
MSVERERRYRNAGLIHRTIVLVSLSLYWSVALVSVSARDCHTSFRRAWRDLSCQEQDDFLDAIIQVKDSGDYDHFIDVHLNVAPLTHGPAEFMPWHRWFIWNFEKLLQQTTGKCIYIPYWDWERDSQWERESDVLHPATFGSWGATNGAGCTMNGITEYHAPFRWSPGVNNGPAGCVTRDFLDGFSFSGEAQVLAMIANYNQFSDTTGNARGNTQDNPVPTGTTNGFRFEFENGGHMLVHGVIAGHMGSNWSPADPLFYLHHANVDRIWTMWQDYHDHDTCSVDEYLSPWHFDSEWALDRALPFQHAERVSNWDFRMTYPDGSQAYPTVRDIMNNDGETLSVRYQNSYLNSLMPDYVANPRLFQVATDGVPVKCDRDEWEWARKKRKLEQERKPEDEHEHQDLRKNSLVGASANSTSTLLFSNHQHVFVPNAFRSSIRGKDAQEIEDHPELYFRKPGDGRVKNDLEGNGINTRYRSSDVVGVTSEECGKPPVFSLQEDRDEWDRLCRVLPKDTPIVERLALLAKSNCGRRGNPRSDAPEIRERLTMTIMGAFDAPSSAYECFHRPGDPADEVP